MNVLSSLSLFEYVLHRYKEPGLMAADFVS